MKVKNSVFVVSGGASGLGAATVRMLAGRGGRVVIADTNEVAGCALADELAGAAHFTAADVSSEGDAQAVVKAALDHFGSLQGLVNCAGIAPAEKLVGKDGPHRLESFVRTVSVNLVGTFNMARLAAAAMSAGQPDQSGARGVIVNTASVAAFDGQIGQAAYAASKGGVAAMTLPLARELARWGIRVMTIAPGIFETPMLQGMPAEIQEALGRTVPFPPRLGRPEEYAALVLHIVENQMLNGEVIRLDGALRMEPK